MLYSDAITGVKSTHNCRLAQTHEWVEVAAEIFGAKNAILAIEILEVGKSSLDPDSHPSRQNM